MPVIYDVEIGYAFYEGDAQVWDTSTFEITPELDFDEEVGLLDYLHDVALGRLYKEIEDQGNKIEVAGTWLHSYEEDELSGKAECPQCHQHDDETQIEDHGVCRNCVEINYEDAYYRCPFCGETTYPEAYRTEDEDKHHRICNGCGKTFYKE